MLLAAQPGRAMGAQACRRFDWQRPSVKLLTQHSAKELEFPQVYLAGMQALPLKHETPQDALRLLYVGMTRAAHTLVLSDHVEQGVRALMEQVQRALQAVARRLAQAPTEPGQV